MMLQRKTDRDTKLEQHMKSQNADYGIMIKSKYKFCTE